MKPTLLITGGRGYLGLFLLNRLIHDGSYNVLEFAGDVREKALDIPRVDCIVHLAAKPNSYKGGQHDIDAVNYHGTVNLAQHCHHDTHFVFLSSEYVFPADSHRSYVEKDVTAPETAYGRSKARAEEYLLSNHSKTAIIRTSMLYGHEHPRRKNFFRFVHDHLSNNSPVGLFGDVYSRPTHVEDITAFLLDIMRSRSTGLFHACGDRLIDRYTLGTLIADAHGYSRELIKKENKPAEVEIPNRIDMLPSASFHEFIHKSLQERVHQCL